MSNILWGLGSARGHGFIGIDAGGGFVWGIRLSSGGEWICGFKYLDGRGGLKDVGGLWSGDVLGKGCCNY